MPIKLQTNINYTSVYEIFERAVQKQLTAYFKKHSILCTEQSGFKEQHSTLTATLDVTDHILENMDEGLYTGAVYLDLKKAFDTVNSDTLLFKLKCLGIENNELYWFQNYITDQSQCVQHATATSEYLPITCGVPQGSILGPLLFTIYVNDLPHVIKHSKIALYADDTVLLFASRSLENIKMAINKDLGAATKWFNENKLHLNV